MAPQLCMGPLPVWLLPRQDLQDRPLATRGRCLVTAQPGDGPQLFHELGLSVLRIRAGETWRHSGTV